MVASLPYPSFFVSRFRSYPAFSPSHLPSLLSYPRTISPSLYPLPIPPLSHSQARFYTYIWSLYDCLVAAALCPTVRKFLVLDRPNPAGGMSVDGPIMREKFASFVGRKVRLTVLYSVWKESRCGMALHASMLSSA